MPAKLHQPVSGFQMPSLFEGSDYGQNILWLNDADSAFRAWLKNTLPTVHFMNNEGLCLGGVNFFGGTMWTDFRSSDEFFMNYAPSRMANFFLINTEERIFTPRDSVRLHHDFIVALKKCFAGKPDGPSVVVTHHAPVENPKSRFLGNSLQPAFISYDMPRLIEQFMPDVWIYGHTHEYDSQFVGKTRMLTNQLGYPYDSPGLYECSDTFDEYGRMFELGYHLNSGG